MEGESRGMQYTVKQLASLAGISVRTLHYYDQIGLLKPASVGENGYRYYDKEAALRLQQILFYRELDFTLDEIAQILSRPEFDALEALGEHRVALEARIERLKGLIHTVDSTILYLKGKTTMSQKQLFEEFSAEKQKEYEAEAQRRWGEKHVKESQKRWGSYTAEEKKRVLSEGNVIYQDIIAAMPLGPGSPQVQAMIARWRQHLRYFYEPTPDMLRGLGDLYNDDPDFNANFTRMHPDLAKFMKSAIEIYCQNLPVN